MLTLNVIRTVHTVILDSTIKRKKMQNVYMSDVFRDYLNLYANAYTVITNRVHAAVVSASYGVPVYLANRTPRRGILSRIGCGDMFEKVYQSDPSIIKKEKEQLEKYIRTIFV